MGRLDDAAKRKVVELRKAGLSFRKIKAVLELENIKVSAQAIYLFLREFQGRPPGWVQAVEAGSSTSSPQVQVRAGGMQDNWSNLHLQNLLREASQHSGFAATIEFGKQKSPNSESSVKPCGSGETRGSNRPGQQQEGNKEENDIQIVSVTSLAQSNQQSSSQSNVIRAETSTASSTGTANAALRRGRVTPSPATSSMLAARKRLLDKALSHRMKSFQQVASFLRRDQSRVQGADMRNAIPQPETYDLTTERTVLGSQPGGNGGNTPRRFFMQRPSFSIRSLHPPPRVGIRLPNRQPAPLTSSAPGGAVIRLPSPSGQGTPRSEGNPSPQQAVPDSGGRGGLQDQIQSLSSEVRSLGMAVKMLVEQQCRLEREQAQQTSIQKQILSTLQSFSSKVGHCSSVQQQHNKTPSPSLPAASISTSFSQDSFNFTQGSYAQCSQAPSSYNSLEGLESVEAFKLPGLSPTNMNGFSTCSSAESLPLTHTPLQTQPYTTAYPQQSSQTRMQSFAQTYVSEYNQSHSQMFRGSETKTDFPSSCSAQTLHSCSSSTQPVMSSGDSPQDQQINIKVEGP